MRWSLTSMLLCALLAPVELRAQEDALPLSAQEVLERGLTNFYPNSTALFSFETFVEGRRIDVKELRVWVGTIDGRSNVRAEFQSPFLVRGTQVLVKERNHTPTGEMRSNDYWFYPPAMRRVKRVGGSQRGDRFFGTALSFGDMEVRDASHFNRFAPLTRSTLFHEEVWIVEATPRFEGGYERVRFYIAVSDYALLRIEQIEEENEEATRSISMNREWLVTVQGHILPKRMEVLRGEDVKTVVTISGREVNPEMSRSLFSLSDITLGK